MVGRDLLADLLRRVDRQTSDGTAVQWFSAGLVNRISLHDGSTFLSAGRIDWLATGGFVMAPDVGKAGDMSALCALS